MLCRVIQVSRSDYYSWQEQPKSVRQQENEKLNSPGATDPPGVKANLWSSLDIKSS